MKRAAIVLGAGAIIISAVAWKIGPELYVTWMLKWREIVAKIMSEESKRNLETEVIRIEIEGRRYNVPIRYTYGQAIEKHNRWPKAKPERVKVGALTLSVLLPDMKPYYPEDDDLWKVRGHGNRVEVTITNSLGVPGWFQRYRGRYLRGENRYSTRKEDTNGLIYFQGHGYTSDTYFPVDSSTELTMSCDSETRSADFFPSCNVKSNYKPEIALDYYYGKEFMLNWQKIDSKLKALFDQFELSAQSEGRN